MNQHLALSLHEVFKIWDFCLSQDWHQNHKLDIQRHTDGKLYVRNQTLNTLAFTVPELHERISNG